RDYKVTGVQTCALPIWRRGLSRSGRLSHGDRQAHQGAEAPVVVRDLDLPVPRSSSLATDTAERIDVAFADRPQVAGTDLLADREIGRASCRDRVERWVG